MCNIKVGRYDHPSVTKDWQGWIEPEDRSWIAFIRADGTPVFYLERDPETGAIVGGTTSPPTHNSLKTGVLREEQ